MECTSELKTNLGPGDIWTSLTCFQSSFTFFFNSGKLETLTASGDLWSKLSWYCVLYCWFFAKPGKSFQLELSILMLCIKIVVLWKIWAETNYCLFSIIIKYSLCTTAWDHSTLQHYFSTTDAEKTHKLIFIIFQDISRPVVLFFVIIWNERH